MADITARMADLKARIDELASLAASEHRERASSLAGSLAEELERLG